MFYFYSITLLKNLGRARWQHITPLVKQSTNAARVPSGGGSSKDPLQYM